MARKRRPKTPQAEAHKPDVAESAGGPPASIPPEPAMRPSTGQATGTIPKTPKSDPVENITNLASEMQLAKPLGQLEWNRSCQGTVINPYPNNEERRKFIGTAGRKIKLLTNHFDMPKITKTVFIYEIIFEFPWKGLRKRQKPLHYRCMEMVKQSHAGKEFPPKTYGVIFDGMNTIYSSVELKLGKGVSGNFEIVEEPDIDANKKIPVKYTIKRRSEGAPYVNISEAIRAFEKGNMRGKFESQPLEAVQILNIILSYGANLDPKFVNLGRRFFQPDQRGRVENIGGGKFLWLGSFESVRVGWKIRLNIDMANKPAYEKGPLELYLIQFLNVRNLDQVFAKPHLMERAEKEIKDLKARFRRPDNKFRKYRMLKFVKKPKEQFMKLDDGKKISIWEYFEKEYKYKIKHPNWPLVHCGDPKRTIYLPLELLDLERQVCPQSKLLGEESTSKMIKVTAVKPHERFEKIKENLRERNANFKNDLHANAFGISVNDKPMTVDARILNPPDLQYFQDASGQKPVRVIYKKDNNGNFPGKWNPPPKSQFRNAIPLTKWVVLDTAKVRDNEWNNFLDALYNDAKEYGMNIDYPIQGPGSCTKIPCGIDKLETELKSFKKNNPNLQLAMVLVDLKDSQVYAKVKLLGDTELKIPTQFLLKKNISKRQQDGSFWPDRSTVHNIVIKLNSKLGGTNQTLDKLTTSKLLGPIFQQPIMVMGADVTHPAPDQLGLKPSIAAIVGSYDPSVSKYFCEVRIQFKDKDAKHVVEEILSMEDVTKTLLEKFYKETRQKKPQRIIFYRDGVSEGQFQIVLNKEISAIQRACLSLEEGYMPGITYIVAQKRHHTRFFPEKKSDQLKNGNVVPGTVVDTDITHPTVSSYYLASHEGIQGTTKPTYYVKLYDDNNLTSDQEQALTYYLCHLYSRCERSVSYPAPTYYAHLAAFRAREHHNALLQKYGWDSSKIPKEELSKMENLDLTNYFV